MKKINVKSYINNICIDMENYCEKEGIEECNLALLGGVAFKVKNINQGICWDYVSIIGDYYINGVEIPRFPRDKYAPSWDWEDYTTVFNNLGEIMRAFLALLKKRGDLEKFLDDPEISESWNALFDKKAHLEKAEN